MPTESAAAALKILRDGSQFQWYLIPLLAFVVYVYAVEVEKRNFNAVFAGLAFWGLDWFNEIWNALIFHFTQYAPAWGAPGDTAFLLLIGLNIEICFMFAVSGVVWTKFLPRDRSLKILGLPNRLFLAITFAIICVVIEILLNAVGALTWEYSLWNTRFPLFIFLVGYLPFFLFSFRVYDMAGIRKKAVACGVVYGVDIAALVVFGCVLKWI